MVQSQLTVRAGIMGRVLTATIQDYIKKKSRNQYQS